MTQSRLEPRHYIDAAVFKREQTQIFRKLWQWPALGHNKFIEAATGGDLGATAGGNAGLGAGAAIARAASVGAHPVICDLMHIGAVVSVGRHCVVDVPGHYDAALVDGTFIDALFPVAARIYAAGRPASKSATVISGDFPNGRAA